MLIWDNGALIICAKHNIICTRELNSVAMSNVAMYNICKV